MWMRYIFQAIIVAGIAYGSYYMWRGQKEKEEASQEAKLLAEKISIRLDANADGAAELYKILAHFYRIEVEGKDKADPKSIWSKLSEGIKDSDDAYLRKGSGQLSRSIRANYEIAQKSGVFDEESNVISMEEGRPPVIQKGAYFSPTRDTYLVASHIVSPIFAPEVTNSLPNLRLVPEPVAKLRIEEIDLEVMRTASDLKSMGVLTSDSFDLLSRLNKKKREDEAD